MFAFRQVAALSASIFVNAFALQASSGKSGLRAPDEIATEAIGFTAFKQRHGRTYEENSQEHQMRLDIFRRRAAEVDRLNSRPGRLWTAGLNILSDRTDEELSVLKGWKPSSRNRQSQTQKQYLADVENAILPDSSDWLHLSNMAMIRDQGGCGSCWAVTSTTVLDAHSEIHASNQTFSTQQIVDCVPNPNACGGTGGCEGATVELAFQYVMMAGAKDPDTYGAYTATTGSCDWTPTHSTTPSMKTLTEFSTEADVFSAPEGAPGLDFGMRGWQRLPANTYKPLLHAVHTYGPVAVALAANDIMMYDKGIFDECEDWVVNHAVTLVGYGVDGGEKYWLVQNSWGSYWGENGRIRISRSDDEEGHCGMDKDPQAGIACKGETEAVKVCGTCGILFDSVVPRFDADSL